MEKVKQIMIVQGKDFYYQYDVTNEAVGRKLKPNLTRWAQLSKFPYSKHGIRNPHFDFVIILRLQFIKGE